MRASRSLLCVVCLLGSWLCLTPHVSAQSDGFAFTGLNFNFTNPGARARGIGGAFVAIADDSTAALANPAGIAYLGREATLELARDEEVTAVGQLTQGDVQVVDEWVVQRHIALADPFREETGSQRRRVNFASVLLPVIANRMTFAAYYATIADMAASFSVGRGLVCVDAAGHARLPGAGEECVLDFLDPDSELATYYTGQEVAFRLTTTLAGGSLGYRVSDRLSVGLSLAYSETMLDAGALLDRAGLVEDQTQLSTVDDTSIVSAVGLLYRSQYWGLGLSYRSGSGYRTDNEFANVGGDTEPERFTGELQVPERFAFGIALFPADEWVITAEVDRIPYSDVLAHMRTFNQTFDIDFDISYQISDVTEYHLGIEYSTFSDRRGWSLRAGYWRDTSHLPWVDEPYQDARQNRDNLRAVESLIRARADRDIDHFTTGIGLSLGTRLRVDTAVDYSPQAGTDLLLSGVVYF